MLIKVTSISFNASGDSTINIFSGLRFMKLQNVWQMGSHVPFLALIKSSHETKMRQEEYWEIIALKLSSVNVLLVFEAILQWGYSQKELSY